MSLSSSSRPITKRKKTPRLERGAGSFPTCSDRSDRNGLRLLGLLGRLRARRFHPLARFLFLLALTRFLFQLRPVQILELKTHGVPPLAMSCHQGQRCFFVLLNKR